MFRKKAHRVPTGRLDTLRRLPMFRQYSDEELVRIDGLVYETTIPAGAALTVEGRVRRQVFIVVSGTASVTVGGLRIGSVGFGDLIGEMSMLSNQPQSATVVATDHLRVLVMDPREFGTWVSDARATRWLATDLSEKLVVQTRASAAAIATIAEKASGATALRGRQAGAVHLPA